MELPEIENVIRIWQEEYNNLGALPFINHVQIFETGRDHGSQQSTRTPDLGTGNSTCELAKTGTATRYLSLNNSSC
jgi:hypothetical protein